MQDLPVPDPQSQRLRLSTLIRLRWLAVTGQAITVLFVAYGLRYPLPIAACFVVIAVSAWLNLFLAFRFPATHRLTPFPAFAILAFDALQLSCLLYMTGGLTNPFSTLLIVPVVVSATLLPLRFTLLLGGVVALAASFLVFFRHPLPWLEGQQLAMPFVYVAGMWVAVISTIVFTAIYASRVAEEARQLANALTATELVLQREQHLSALDGLAAAAAHELGTPLATIHVVAREMERSLGDDPRFREDVTLLRSQSERCREILKRLSNLSTVSEDYLARMPFTSLIEEAIAPHRDFGIAIRMQAGDCVGAEPVGRRSPGVIYGLGNLVENAVDFARGTVELTWSWDESRTTVTVVDDGPGFPPEVIDRIGEPYISTREGAEPGGGLGLGLFIAKTLLERSGATLAFRNSNVPAKGACVDVSWPRSLFVEPPAAPSVLEPA
jgi:two-component system, sensor histidine kinase RegB